MPDLIHYRTRCVIFNFIHFWMYLMFWPDRVNMNFFDLLKSDNAWTTFAGACGSNRPEKEKLQLHFGRYLSQKSYRSFSHDPAMFDALRDMSHFLSFYKTNPDLGKWKIFEQNGGFEKVWTRVMPAEWATVADNMHFIQELIIFERCFVNFETANDLDQRFASDIKPKWFKMRTGRMSDNCRRLLQYAPANCHRNHYKL